MPEEKGFVYLLSSANCTALKIGGTTVGPSPRLRSINSTPRYGDLGPWSIVDFVQVHNWRRVEAILHEQFLQKKRGSIGGASELFDITVQQGRTSFNEIDDSLVCGRQKVDALFESVENLALIEKIFRLSGIHSWIDYQGSWTFSLFPSTSGGRIFTLNIDRHEVAFATYPNEGGRFKLCLVVDALVKDFSGILNWCHKHDGSVAVGAYASQMPRAMLVSATVNYEEARVMLELAGLRRALTAYWSEALIDITARGKKSLFARFHNYNAVAALVRHIRSQDNILEGVQI